MTERADADRRQPPGWPSMRRLTDVVAVNDGQWLRYVTSAGPGSGMGAQDRYFRTGSTGREHDPSPRRANPSECMRRQAHAWRNRERPSSLRGEFSRMTRDTVITAND